MNCLRNRTKFVFCLAVGLVFVSVLYSCTSPQPETTPITKQDARAELISSLKGANVEGYKFATEGDEKLEIVSLTNGLLRDRLKLDGSTANVVLKYASVKDKSANTSRTYKIEVAKSGSEVAVLQTDIATGAVVTKDRFPTAQPHDPNAPKILRSALWVSIACAGRRFRLKQIALAEHNSPRLRVVPPTAARSALVCILLLCRPGEYAA